MAERSLREIDSEIVGKMLEISRQAVAKCGNTTSIQKLTEKEWQRIFIEACIHSVQGLFFEVAKKYLKSDTQLYQNWEQTYTKAVAREQNYESALNDILNMLETAEICHIPLNEMELCRKYPQKGMRYIEKIDILYDDRKKSQVMKSLKEIGYQLHKSDADSDIFVNDELITVVMRKRLFSKKSKITQKSVELFNVENQVKDKKYEYFLSKENQYLYFVSGAKQHFDDGTMGFCTLNDSFLFLREYKTMKLELQAILAKSNIKKFAENLQKLTHVIYEDKSIHLEEKNFEVMYYIMGDGAFGKYVDYENPNAAGFRSMMIRIKRKLFPDFNTMRMEYPVLLQNPILLPFMWVHRWGRLLLRKDDEC